MADRGEQIRRAGIYYLAGIILLALSFCARGELALTALLCVFAAGFILAGHLLWKNSVYLVLALGAAILYFSADGLLAAGLLFLLVLGLVHWRRRFPKRKPVQRRRRVDGGNGRVAGPVFRGLSVCDPGQSQYGDYHRAFGTDQRRFGRRDLCNGAPALRELPRGAA